MKKILFTLFLGLFCLLNAHAQSDDEKLNNDLERIEKQLQESLKDFGMNFDSKIFVDTLFFEDMEDMRLGDNFQQFFKESDISTMMEEMMGLMQEGMGSMESLDWSTFEKMFEQLGIDSQQLPTPEGEKSDSTKEKDLKEEKTKEKQKKRKTYSL